MVQTKNKIKTRSVIITIALSVISVTIIIVLSLFFNKKIRLDRALENLNIETEQTVIDIMKLDGDNPVTVMYIINKYYDAGKYTDASRLLLYYVQYLDCEDDAAFELLSECYALSGADDAFLNQLVMPKFKLSEFEIITELDGTGYGSSNGVYTSFYEDTAKAKISGIIPLAMSACPSGVYVLDSSDNMLKLIRRDGSCIETVHDSKMTEFVYFENHLYYIDMNGVAHGPNEVETEDGIKAMNLRIDHGNVVCTLYDDDYNKIRDITL